MVEILRNTYLGTYLEDVVFFFVWGQGKLVLPLRVQRKAMTDYTPRPFLQLPFARYAVSRLNGSRSNVDVSDKLESKCGKSNKTRFLECVTSTVEHSLS